MDIEVIDGKIVLTPQREREHEFVASLARAADDGAAFGLSFERPGLTLTLHVPLMDDDSRQIINPIDLASQRRQSA